MPGGSLSVGRTPSGYCLRLQGRCTMAESPAAHACMERALRDGAGTVHVDVGQCTYLDSTFLGALLDLHRRYGKTDPPKFVLTGDADARRRLFEATHLHTVFRFAPACPGPIDAWIDLPCQATSSPADLARHVMECHQRLAEVNGPNQAAFKMIAQQLERELSKTAAAPGQA